MTRRTLVPAAMLLCAAAALGQNNVAPNNPPVAAPVATDHAAGPRSNTAVGNSRVLVPDGTSVTDNFSAGTQKWFAVQLEGGKAYNLEVIADPYSDLGNNSIGAVDAFAGDGTTVPPQTNVSCSGNLLPPGLEISSDGIRCTLRPYVNYGSTENYQKQSLYIRVSQGVGTGFKIRIRETTVYSRWTVNGYNNYVALQNNTGYAVDVDVLYYDDSGTQGGAGNPGFVVAYDRVSIPAFGSTQVIRNAGSLTPNHGTLRVNAAPGVDMTTAHINLQTYCFNPASGSYLFFVPDHVNDGTMANSW